MLTRSDQQGPSPLGAPSAAAPVIGGSDGATQRWQTRYVRRIAAGDAVAAVLAAGSAFEIRFGADTGAGGVHGVRAETIWLTALFPLVWFLTLLVARTYEQRFLWVGPEEFRKVFDAGVLLLATVGTVSWAFKLEVARGLVVVALPLATLLSLLQRYAQRARLHRHRSAGRFQQTMLVVGHRAGVTALHQQIDRAAYHGYRVVGCCLPTEGAHAVGSAESFGRLPVLGGLDEVVDVVRRYRVDAVAVLPSPELDGPALRRLGWDLESTRAELLLAPAVTEVVGPRVNIRPLCGLPLLHMERPELRGVRRLAKETTDRTAAGLALVLLLPAMVTLALAIRLTSRGPVLFRQQRVGRDGRTFTMLKFRSMVSGADGMATTLEAPNDGNGVLFKLRDDPRVTPVGRALRRYSLDELPQLINVLRGDMSLVGPRPPLPHEVERYPVDMRRRFLVKPGLTGLWQVSGRSDLSWDDSVRIDVRYVENWSLAFDFMILWKTFGAVLRGPGAY